MARANPSASSSLAAGDLTFDSAISRRTPRIGTITTALPVSERLSSGARGSECRGLFSCAALRTNQDSRPFSSLSNIWTGWLGMIVEMACL
jgi:hypothetical protein